MTTEAYKQGYQAAKDGKDLSDNPHVDEDYEQWQDGFIDYIIDSDDNVMSS